MDERITTRRYGVKVGENCWLPAFSRTDFNNLKSTSTVPYACLLKAYFIGVIWRQSKESSSSGGVEPIAMAYNSFAWMQET